MKFSVPRSLLVVGASIVMTACATIGPPKPPSLDLPLPPTDLKAVRKGDRVTLTWTTPTATTDRQTIRSLGQTRICRLVGVDTKLTQCGTPVGQAPAVSAAEIRKSAGKKTSSTYIDALSSDLERANSAGMVRYALEVLNPDGRGAGLSNVVAVPAAQAAGPPGLTAKLTKDGVVLSCTEPALDTGAAAYFYRIFRRKEGSDHSDLVAELKPRTTETIDHNFEWEKTYFYRATTVSEGHLSDRLVCAPHDPKELGIVDCTASYRIEGDDTPEIKIFADDVFPPAVPSGLQAVSSGPGQSVFIDLIWAPVSDMDLVGYNLYRREEGGVPAVKVNKELVKAPAYRDTDVVSGKSYFYSVSAVDARGNESARSEEAGEKVP